MKTDRRRLYGWTEIEATDDAGSPCEVATTDETGHLVLPRGGTAAGLLTSEGRWVERSELKTVTADGEPAPLLPSSYDTEIVLRKKVQPAEFLDHNITDFYVLSDASDELRRLVGDDIYTFEYCYNKDCEGSPAFVLASGERLFLLLGERLCFETVGYDEPAFFGGDDAEEDEEEEFDFAMF